MATPSNTKKNNVSPAKALELPGATCKYCHRDCTEEGENSKAVQCEICYSWVHASCDGLSNEDYDLFNKLSTTVSNIAYCCNLNYCFSRLNQLTSGSYTESTTNLDQTLKLITDNHTKLQESISNVT